MSEADNESDPADGQAPSVLGILSFSIVFLVPERGCFPCRRR